MRGSPARTPKWSDDPGLGKSVTRRILPLENWDAILPAQWEHCLDLDLDAGLADQTLPTPVRIIMRNRWSSPPDPNHLLGPQPPVGTPTTCRDPHLTNSTISGPPSNPAARAPRSASSAPSAMAPTYRHSLASGVRIATYRVIANLLSFKDDTGAMTASVHGRPGSSK